MNFDMLLKRLFTLDGLRDSERIHAANYLKRVEETYRGELLDAQRFRALCDYAEYDGLRVPNRAFLLGMADQLLVNMKDRMPLVHTAIPQSVTNPLGVDQRTAQSPRRQFTTQAAGCPTRRTSLVRSVGRRSADTVRWQDLPPMPDERKAEALDAKRFRALRTHVLVNGGFAICRTDIAIEADKLLSPDARKGDRRSYVSRRVAVRRSPIIETRRSAYRRSSSNNERRQHDFGRAGRKGT